MILISFKSSDKANRLKEKLSIDIKKEKIIVDDGTLSYSKNNKKYRIVISDYDKEKILMFLNNNSVVFLVDKISTERIDKNLFYNNKFHITESYEKLIKKLDKYPRRNNKIGWICLLIFIIIVELLVFFNYKEKEKVKSEKIKTEEIVDYQKENIVFLGDSITEFYNVATFYPGLPVVNSGKSGNKTDDVYNSLKEKVYIYNPTKVFLMIGTNDLAFRSEKYIVNRIVDIVNEIHKNRKYARVYVESIYPINNTSNNDVVVSWMVGTRSNEVISSINSKLLKKSKDYNFTYINMYDELIDSSGNLKLSYTIDGLHISPEGYKIITKNRLKYI